MSVFPSVHIIPLKDPPTALVTGTILDLWSDGIGLTCVITPTTEGTNQFSEG